MASKPDDYSTATGPLGGGGSPLPGVALLLVVSLTGSSCLHEQPSEAPLASVAVLPMRNLSADPTESDYLAEGIAQAVITKLTQAGLRVTPWETARRYRDREESPDAIARELHVDAVLLGTFQLSNERILTTLSLVESESGLQSWAAEFEEPLEDIFEVQRRIAGGAVSSLRAELSPEQEAALAEVETVDLDAYDLYLQGAHVMQEGSEESLDVALQYFARALEMDDALVEAHVGLGAVYYERYFSGWAGPESLDRAASSFERALALDPASTRARRGLMRLLWERGDTSEAILQQGRLAARFGASNDVESLLAQAEAYHFGGLHEQALPLFERVLDLDPANQGALFLSVPASFYTGRYEDAIAFGQDYLRRFGAEPVVRVSMAHAYHLLGDTDNASVHYRKLLESRENDGTTYPVLAAILYGGLLEREKGDHERAEAIWRGGVDRVRRGLETSPDLTRLRIFLASFHALLGEAKTSESEETRALAAPGVNPWDLYQLAAARAATGKAGEMDRAIELLRLTVRLGRIDAAWRPHFEMASPLPVGREAFAVFQREHEELRDRLRESY